MDTKTLFNEKLPKSIAENPQKARELDAVYLFKVSGDGGGTWTVDLKSDPPSVVEGEAGTPDCTIEVADSDFESMLDNPQMGMQLFFQGKIKIAGDPMLATKLQNLLSL
jgi:putative sterol carrier protein